MLCFYFLFFLFAICSFNLSAQQSLDSSITDSSILVPDDPILASINKAFDSGFIDFYQPFCDSSKLRSYNFSYDSVPVPSDSLIMSRLAVLDTKSPFHIVYNESVKNWIALYVIKKRRFSSRILGLSFTYCPIIEQLLDKYDLPLELKNLVIVESAFNPMARSRSGAVGLWQFVYNTGKLMGLQIDSYIDERRDVYKSTRAACEYFSYLYNIYNNWELVLAAYNCGPGNVNRALRKSEGKTNYWDIWPFLPKETRGYVPAFFAANYLMAYYEDHNLCPSVPKLNFFDFDTVYVHKTTSLSTLATVLEIPLEDMEYLNPSYKRDVIPVIDKPALLCLPKDKKGLFITNETAIYNINKDTLNSVFNSKQQIIRKTHIVRSGQYLGHIAKKYHCSIADIKDWNGLRSTIIYPGQRLIIYVPSKISDAEKTNNHKTNALHKQKNNGSSYQYYTIQKGDTLWDIAKSLGVSIDNIIYLNKGIDEKNLKPGTKIKIRSEG